MTALVAARGLERTYEVRRGLFMNRRLRAVGGARLCLLPVRRSQWSESGAAVRRA